MDETSPLISARTEALGKAYAALNRNDVPGFVAMFDPQVERIEDFGEIKTIHGLDAVRAHVLEGRRKWAEGSCEPERFVASGDRIIVRVKVRVRLKTEEYWREGLIGDVFTFHSGKVTQFCSFIDERRAIEWVDVSDSNGPTS